MTTSIRLNDGLITSAKLCCEAESRSAPKQIEYWAKVGKIMIDNPDLTYHFVHESLLATEEMNIGIVKPHVRRTKRS